VVLVGLESLKDFNVIGMPERFKDVDFVHDLLLLGLFLHEIHVYRFDGHQLPRKSVKPEVDLPKSSFTEHLSDFIEFQLSFRWLSVPVKAIHY